MRLPTRSLCRYKPAVIQHCLQVYGHTAGTQQADAASPQPDTTGINSSSSSEGRVLDERRVCLHFARKLLKQRPVWLLREFLPAWQQEVPGSCWCPQEGMLAGEALVMQADPSEGEWSSAVVAF